jgi:hypothetical protein
MLAPVPALIAPLVGFALGVILAWTGGRELDRDLEAHRLDSRAVIVVAYAVLVFAPVNAYFLAFAGDWSFAYLFDSRALPSAVALFLVLLDAALVWAGFVVGRRVRQERAAGLSIALAGAPLIVSAAAVLLLHGRLRADATFDQIRSGFGVAPIAKSPLGLAIVWMNLMLCVGLGLAAKALNRPLPVPAGAGIASGGAGVSVAGGADNPPRRLGSGSTSARTRPDRAPPD